MSQVIIDHMNGKFRHLVLRLGGCVGPLLLVTLAAVEPCAAQEATIWFPGDFVTAPLLANPMEVHLGAGIVATDRDIQDSIDGTSLEAQVAIGFRLPVVRLQDEARGRPAIDLGFEAGVWSRFYLESTEGDQIATDYRVGLPLGLRTGLLDFRITLLHVSSHLGDDYIDDNPQAVFQSSREGFELLAGIRPGAEVRLYAGGDLNFGRSQDFTGEGTPDDPYVIFTTIERWAFRFGAEWDRTRWGDRRIAPFAAANFEVTELTDRIASNVKAGAVFRVRAVRLYLGLEVHDGPSPMGQFRTTDERWIGINLSGEI